MSDHHSLFSSPEAGDELLRLYAAHLKLAIQEANTLSDRLTIAMGHIARYHRCALELLDAGRSTGNSREDERLYDPILGALSDSE